ASRRPRYRAPRRGDRLPGLDRRVRAFPYIDAARMRRDLLLLRKDALVLRRSPLLFAVLLIYPVMIAVLVGLVATYVTSKPRVGLVDEDHLPATIVVAGHRFHVNRTIREVSRNLHLVRLPAAEANRELQNGKLVATLTVPPGFIADLKG